MAAASGIITSKGPLKLKAALPPANPQTVAGFIKAGQNPGIAKAANAIQKGRGSGPAKAAAAIQKGRGTAPARVAKSILPASPTIPPSQPRYNIPSHVGGEQTIKAILSSPTTKTASIKPTKKSPTSVVTQARKALQTEGAAVGSPPNPQATTSTAVGLPPSATLRTVPVPNLDPYAGRTPGQVAQAQLNPQLNLVTQNTAAERNAIQGMAQAIMAQLHSYGPEVAQDYNQAQQTVNGLAQAAGQQLAAANPNAADQAMLQSIGAPQSQQDAVAQSLQSAFQGGGAVLGTTQGAIPSASLAAQKAAALAYAQNLPAIQGLAAQNALRNILYQGAQQKAQIEAQAPAIINQVATAKANAKQGQFSDESANAAAVASNALARAGFAQNNAALGLKSAQQGFENGVAIARLNLDYKKLSADELKAAAAIGLSQARLKQNAAKFSAQAAPAQQKVLQKVSAEMEDWYYGKPGTQHFDTKTRTWIQAPNGTPPITYDQAIYRAIAQGLPYQAAVALANAYYQPGEGGRPNTVTWQSLAAANG